ncbi:MAG: inositol monophosphatase family protein, partial [Pseudomonadota bacterium]
VLEEARPEDGILGEEEAPKASRSGLTWVLDPIDGTRAFVAGMPTWGTLIAVNAGGAPLAGLIDQPFIGERFWGDTTGGWYRRKSGDAQPLRARAPRALADATLFSTFPEIGTAQERAAFERVSHAVRLTRYGTDCYAYGLLALGQIDLVIEAGLQAYDIQGPMAVVTGAGGIVTNWRGGPAEQGGQVIAAANERIHADAVAMLSEAG